MDNRTMIGALALVAALAGTVQAETWYFTGNEETSNVNAYTDPTVWKNMSGAAATAFNAADTYVVTNFGPGETTATAHAIIMHGGTFANGARLEVNGYGASGQRPVQKILLASDCTSTTPAVFSRGFYLGHNAQMFCPAVANSTNVIEGEVTMDVSNGGQSPYLKASRKNQTLVFKNKMIGAGRDRGLLVYPDADAGRRNFTVKFLDDVTWAGSIYLRDQGSVIATTCDYNVRLVLGNISFNPTVRVDGKGLNSLSQPMFNARTRMRIAVDTVADTATIQGGLDSAQFPLHDDTYLEFPVDATTGNAGKMVLTTRLYGSTNEWIGVVLTGDLFGGTATNRFELMSVPVANPLNASSFHLINDQGLDGSVVKFEVVNGATYSTLYAVVPPMVRYTKCDSSSQSENKGSYIESGDGWSNGSAPQPGCNYLVLPTNATEMILRPPDNDINASYTFRGDSLTIASNASLRCYLHTLNVADLKLLNGSALYCSRCGGSESPGRLNVNGNIDISGTVRIGTYHSLYMNFTNATFTGSGTIDFGGLWIADNATARYRLWGDNSGFAGKMIVRTAYRDANSVPALNADYGELYLRGRYALGSDLPTPTPDALTLTDFAILWPDESSYTLYKESNRGITCKGVARIWTSGNYYARIETPLTIDGECHKIGNGTLTLAGAATAVTGGGTDKFVISNGLLRVANANALKGLAVYFRVGTSLMVMPDLTDAELTAKGLDLSGLDDPITLAASFGGKIPFVETPVADRTEVPFGVTEYGLLTVKATFADTLRSMLPTTPPRHFAKGSIAWTEKTVDGLTTFGVRYHRAGFMLSIR